MPSTTALVAAAESRPDPAGSTKAARLACHAALANAAAARRMSSALTASPGPLPTPTATIVLPSSASNRAVSPTLPPKPLDARKRLSSSTVAPLGTTPFANTGTPRYLAFEGTSAAARKAIGIELLLGATREGLAFLPAGHGPQQVGEPVEIGHDRAAVGRGRQGQPLGPADDRASHIELRRGAGLARNHELGRHGEALVQCVDVRLQPVDHLGRHEARAGHQLGTVVGFGGQLGHQDPEVALEVDEQRVELGTALGVGAGDAEGGLGLVDSPV